MKKLELTNALPTSYQLYDWATNLPVLLRVLQEFRPTMILELGAGNFSSSLFAAYVINNPSATCLSLDNNKEWIEGLSLWQVSNRHRIEYIENYDESNLPDNHYDLVFIDQNPEQSRIQSLEFYRTRAKVVCLHDANYPDRYGKSWDQFSFNVWDKRFKFYTYCGSMTIDVTSWWQQ